MKEIGSEFWESGPKRRNKVYLLSGRTALAFIIKDIIDNFAVESVLLPSYCCHTMIEPFIRNNISVRFYDVYYSGGNGLSVNIPTPKENEIFYYMKYFGFSGLYGCDLSEIRKNFSIIIEDKTHTWLCDDSRECADYSYTSYRKWTGLEGISSAEKREGLFSSIPVKTNEEYFKLRKKAFSLKNRYVSGEKIEKESFLGLFIEAENLLEIDYEGYKPHRETTEAFQNLDIIKIISERRKNAGILIEKLKNIPEINLIYNSLESGDVPLFVPILVKDRDKLRTHLSSNGIYCPAHWPKSDFHTGISIRAEQMYNEEISIICDQRYSKTDMIYIVDVITKYYAR